MYKILVADDEPMIREVVTRALDNYEVLQAVDGVDAMTKLAQHNDISLLLSDWDMYPMNGPQLIKLAKTTYPEVIRGMMSGYHGSRLQAYELGATFFIKKPFTMSVLRATVDMYVEAMISERTTVIPGEKE